MWTHSQKHDFDDLATNNLKGIPGDQQDTTRFVTFAIQKPSDTQVMMLAVRSHANMDLFNWPYLD